MELEQIIREIYRVPISSEDQVSVEIEGQAREVINLGGQGIGIRLEQPDIYEVNALLPQIHLHLDGENLSLQGRIVHISPSGKGTYLCGIKLLELDEKSRQKLHECIYRIRTRIFTQE